ncbi:hypothetical protein N7519_007876 [Penicillium mononematosum]|uniref:uncharacterized protein n=1 Tax=Penicillium mononematosum TaxID=268346 RepID=UPI002546C690|nr:uncharacterized protein N7519_007876 [Penicillium mononematosum]KAJ6186575.1 hypothetical protein N7519_007876 [Penicillium mononematosum]
MSYQGHCNCESIRITLPEQPDKSCVCHCDCCKRSGGGAFSVNYFVSEDEMTVDDPNATLKVYEDKKSVTGNAVKRHFCSACGSPVYTKSPIAAGKVFLKASLFDTVTPPAAERFLTKQYEWVNLEQSTPCYCIRGDTTRENMTESSAQDSGPRQPSGVILRNARPPNDNDMDTREALELQQTQTQEDNELNYSTPSASSGDEYRVVTRRTTSHADAQRRQQARKGTWGKLTQLWTHNVTLTVPHKSSRDYFALERTFLAYIRTSLVVAQQGVLIAQLFRLQAAEALADRLGFRRVGTPLSVACHCVAILVALVGAYRFWRQQSAIARGRIFAGGWELNSVGILLGCITLTVLIVSIAMVVETPTDTWGICSTNIGWVNEWWHGL